MRKVLIQRDMLDSTLKPRREEDALLLPIIGWCKGAERCEFNPRPERLELPRHELIGGIAIVQDHNVEGATRILVSRPSLHTVLYPTSEITGNYRTRSFDILAGIPTTRTYCTEYGHRFAVDLSGAYFSTRLATERHRIASLVGKKEIVLDMFAGVGPFTIYVAEKASLVMAVDLNPHAIVLLLENLARNRIRNVMPVLADAQLLPHIIFWKFDRIIMNLPLAGSDYLPVAFELVCNNGMIHFYALVSREEEYKDLISSLGGEVISERFVHSYSPTQWHAVYDIVVK